MNNGNRDSKSDGCVLIVSILVYGLLQVYAAYLGIQHHLGTGWAIVAIGALFFRFSLPITIGAFFGAMDVWGWHWFFALLFALPSLAFMALMVPSIFTSVIGRFRR
jgi:hypothetical protein